MAALAPAAATSLGTTAAVGTGTAALGTGLTMGTTLGTGLATTAFPGIVGGVAPGAFGAGVGSALAPTLAAGVGKTVAASTLPGVIGGSVAPGAFGAGASGLTSTLAPSLTTGLTNTAAASGLPGIVGGSVTPGAFGANLAGGAGANLAGAAQGFNPATAEALAPKFLANSPPIADPSKLNFLRSSTAGGEVMPLETLNSFSPVKQGLDPSALQRASLSNPTGASVNPADIVGRSIRPDQNFIQNLGNIGSFQDFEDYTKAHPYATAGMAGLGAMGISKMMQQKKVPTPENNAMIRPYEFEYGATGAKYQPGDSTSEQLYFNPTFTAGEPYRADEKAEGGIASAYAVGGPVETMSAMNAVGGNMMYPQANLQTAMYSNPMMQRPEATNVIAPSADAGVGAYSGEPRFASGGVSHLGDYSDGGRLLKGPGDGVSDSIPASIGGRQPARLADGEFVIPARIVSELGNGSTEAGARKLYAMMERVQASRKKSIGKKKVAVNSKADKHLPA